MHLYFSPTHRPKHAPNHELQVQVPERVASPPSQQPYVSPQDPTVNDVFRYRYQHGANLGSIFVLEKWLFPSLFPNNATSSQTSELEAVKASVEDIGVNATRFKWENHWQTALSVEDIRYLTSVGCTSIRLPVGYWTLSASFCKNTPFDLYASVYVNAWACIKALVNECCRAGIGMLLDFHALPGGANTGDHSGTNSGVANLWNNSVNLDLATKCLCFMAQQIRDGPLQGVVGLQLCNEAIYNAPGMYEWYDNVIANISRIDASIPLYLSDGWDLSQCIAYAQAKNGERPVPSAANPVVIDSHLYWAFNDGDKAMSPEQIINDVSNKLHELDGKDGDVVDRGAIQVCVGEYSCVMDGSSWAQTTQSRPDLVRQFGNAQCRQWQARSGGAFFWTYKMEWMPGGEWGFMAQTTPSVKGKNPPGSPSVAIYAPPNLLLGKEDVYGRLQHAINGQDAARQSSVDAHVMYWDRTSPGKRFEHWRYEAGWKLGFGDASVFFGARGKGELGGILSGGDKIGMLDLWIRKRIGDSQMGGEFLWEFERKSHLTRRPKMSC